jgi:5-methylcytosine-specific restriction endonuclease McrA
MEYARECRKCGTEFTAHRKEKVFCSRKCQRNAWNIADKHRRNAAYSPVVTVKGSDFTSREVFVRDSYVCQICKKATNPRTTYPDDAYPTIDHIIPTSKGGLHTLENVQCACASCNRDKSNKVE